MQALMLPRSSGAGARPAAASPTAARWPLLPTPRVGRCRRHAGGAAAAGTGNKQQPPERNSSSSNPSRSRSRSRSRPRTRQQQPEADPKDPDDKRARGDGVTPQFATAALSRAALPRHLVAAWERYADARNPRHVAAATKRVAVMAPEALQRAHERRRLIYEQQREQQQREQREQREQQRERGGQQQPGPQRERSRSRAAPPRRAPLLPYALEPDLRALTAVAVSAAGAALSLGERSQGGLEDGALVSVVCALAGVLTTLHKGEAQGFLLVVSGPSAAAPPPSSSSSSSSSSFSSSTSTAAAEIAAAAAQADAALLRVSLAHVSDALLPRLGRLPPRRLQQALWALSSLGQPQQQQPPQQPTTTTTATNPSTATAATAGTTAPPPPSLFVSAPLDANPYDSSAPVPHPAAVATAARGASVAASYRRAGEWLRAFEAASARQLRASAAAAEAAGAGAGEGAAEGEQHQQQQQQHKAWSHGGDVISLPSLAQILVSLVRLGYCPGTEWWAEFWAASRPALSAAAAAGAGAGGGGGAAADTSDSSQQQQQQQQQLDPQLVQELLGGSSRSPATRAADLSRIVHAVARLGQRPPTHEEQRGGKGRREEQRGRAAAAAASPSPPWTELFLDASCAWLPYSGAEDLTRTIWALGCLGCRPHRAWLMLFFLVSRRAMTPAAAAQGGGGGGAGRAQPGDLALWLQALARLGYTPSPAWLGDYVAATYPYLAAAEAAGAVGGSGEAAAGAAAVAAASTPAPRGRPRSGRQRQAPAAKNSGSTPSSAPAATSSQAMAPADAANLAWAAAAMAWQPPWRYWLALLGALRASLPRLAPRDVANAAWAVGRLAGAPLSSDNDDGAWVLGSSSSSSSGEDEEEEDEAKATEEEGAGGSRGGSGSGSGGGADEAAIAQQLPDGWLADFCRLSAPSLASMSGRELALTAGGLASLRALPGPTWLGALAEAAAARLAQQSEPEQEQELEQDQQPHSGLRPSECRALAGAMARLALRPAPPALLRLQGDLLRAAEEMEGARGERAAAAAAGAGGGRAAAATAVEVL